MRDSKSGEVDLRQLGDDDEISFEPLFSILRGYRRVIAAAAAAGAVLFVLVVLHTYFTRTVQHASAEFRLLFDQADRGEYPNGLPFAASEIISNPVLSQVFSVNGLDQYFGYEEFRNAIFVGQAPTVGVEMLLAEYETEITGQTSLAVRASIDEQVRERRELLEQPLYTLDFIQPVRGADVPDALLEKVLSDILTNWARYAVESKHVFDYQIDVPNPNMVRTELVVADNDAIRLDTLRGRINRILASLDELAALPGAGLIRVGENAVSLSDIGVQLEDLRQSRVRPLLIQILARGDAAGRPAVASYVEGRLFQATLDKEESVAKETALEQGLRTNTAFNHSFSIPAAEGVEEFLERIITIASSLDAIDRPYQRRAVDRIVAAGYERAKWEKEVANYEEMGAWVRGDRTNPLLSRSTDGDGSIGSPVAAIEKMEAVVAQALQQANEIYAEISERNLSTGAGLYAIAGPFSVRIERGGFGRTVAAYGLSLSILMVTLVPAACVVHHWARRLARQSSAERARRRSAASPSEVARPDGT